VIEMVDKPASKKQITHDIHEIMNLIPHRYPFLLVDRVTEHEIGKCIRGYKNVTINEPFFQGHFPANPIMPGVLIVEAMAQLGCVLVANIEEGKDKLVLFAGIDGVRFRRQVVPGDRLDMYGELLKLKGPLGKAYIRATVNDELAADGEILFTLVPRDRGNGANE
jgi:3-hydroxyacyl-[acyl-carrier-protein] dehydratase